MRCRCWSAPAASATTSSRCQLGPQVATHGPRRAAWPYSAAECTYRHTDCLLTCSRAVTRRDAHQPRCRRHRGWCANRRLSCVGTLALCLLDFHFLFVRVSHRCLSTRLALAQLRRSLTHSLCLLERSFRGRRWTSSTGCATSTSWWTYARRRTDPTVSHAARARTGMRGEHPPPPTSSHGRARPWSGLWSVQYSTPIALLPVSGL